MSHHEISACQRTKSLRGTRAETLRKRGQRTCLPNWPLHRYTSCQHTRLQPVASRYTTLTWRSRKRSMRLTDMDGSGVADVSRDDDRRCQASGFVPSYGTIRSQFNARESIKYAKT